MSYSNEIIEQVWEKGIAENFYDAGEYRKDIYDSWMSRVQYRNRNSLFGWEIDRINPAAGDELDNLQPLNYKNYLRKNES